MLVLLVHLVVVARLVLQALLVVARLVLLVVVRPVLLVAVHLVLLGYLGSLLLVAVLHPDLVVQPARLPYLKLLRFLCLLSPFSLLA